MTDKQLEAAARRFCRLEGANPDEKTGCPTYVDGKWDTAGDFRWKSYVRDMEYIYHAILAIEQAMEDEAQPDVSLEQDRIARKW